VAELPPYLMRVLGATDYVPSLALMRRSHVLLVVDAPGDSSVFLPSKLVDYLGAGRPIVALSPAGPTARIVGGNGGWCADPADPAAGAAAISAALTAVRSAASADRGRAPAEFAAPTVAAQFRELVAGATARAGASISPR
jgi:hypothetical protein